MSGTSRFAIPERHSPIRRRLGLVGLALAASLVLGGTAALAGTARAGEDPGVTSNLILLGGTAPLTGPFTASAAVTRGADAYFKHVNSKGGVNGRMIAYKVVDDAANPALTLPATRQLVELEKVFAVFNSVGTASNLAVRSYLNSAKVPQLFVASGATTWSRDAETYPYSIGFQPTYHAEGWVYGKYLARTTPGATIAVLFQNDDSGKELLAGLKRGLLRSKAKVIAAQPYDQAALDISSQMARLKASGADTLAIFATPAFVIQAYAAASKLGWKPKQVIVDAAGASSATMTKAAADGQNKLVNNTISIAFLKDQDDPARKADPWLKLYRKLMERHAPDADAGDPAYLYGMAVAWTAVEALRKAGKNLTRASLLEALDSFTAARNPFLLPGILVKTEGKDRAPIEQMLLERWQNGAWKPFGGLWAYRTA